MESRTQGSRPRPRTQKKPEAMAKDKASEDRPSRGQVQECSRPRTKDTGASVLQKKRSSKFFFRRFQKKGLQKFFQAFYKLSTIQNIVLSSSRGQGKFQGQGQELDLGGQGQGLQNVFSKTFSRPRTSLRTPRLFISYIAIKIWAFSAIFCCNLIIS